MENNNNNKKLTEEEIQKKILGRQAVVYYAKMAKLLGKSEQEFLDSMELESLLNEFPFLENEVEHIVTFVWTFTKR